MSFEDVRQEEFPVPVGSASGLVGGLATEVTALKFTDKILVTISQESRLAQWFQVPLTSSPATVVETTMSSSGQGLLPSTHLTATTLLGGGGDGRETYGQLCAVQIASLLCLKDPEDKRTLVLGLGLGKLGMARETFFDLVELASKAL